MIGGGYVGLISGACFAEFGSDVGLVEVDPVRLKALRTGDVPIYEPGLDQLVAKTSKLAGCSVPTISRWHSRTRRRFSLRSAPRPAAATAMPI
jgi:UDP-glucose 6-dehydrogenase